MRRQIKWYDEFQLGVPEASPQRGGGPKGRRGVVRIPSLSHFALMAQNDSSPPGEPIDISCFVAIIKTDRTQIMSSGGRMHPAEIGLGSPDP